MTPLMLAQVDPNASKLSNNHLFRIRRLGNDINHAHLKILMPALIKLFTTPHSNKNIACPIVHLPAIDH